MLFIRIWVEFPSANLTFFQNPLLLIELSCATTLKRVRFFIKSQLPLNDSISFAFLAPRFLCKIDLLEGHNLNFLVALVSLFFLRKKNVFKRIFRLNCFRSLFNIAVYSFRRSINYFWLTTDRSSLLCSSKCNLLEILFTTARVVFIGIVTILFKECGLF